MRAEHASHILLACRTIISNLAGQSVTPLLAELLVVHAGPHECLDWGGTRSFSNDFLLEIIQNKTLILQ